MSYDTTREQLLDELARIETILDGMTARTDDETAADVHATETTPSNSASRDDSPALPLLLPAFHADQASEHAQEIRERCADTPEHVTLRLRVLADRFDLCRRELDILLLALAPDIDAASKHQYRTVADGQDVVRPTVEFLTALFASTDSQRFVVTDRISSESRLGEHGLVTLVDPDDADATVLDRQLRVPDHIRSYLAGRDELDPALADVATLATPTTTTGDLRLDTETDERIEALSASNTTSGRYYFHGPDGCQQTQAVEALADGQLLRAELRDVLDAGVLDRLHREALLQDCSMHLTNATAALTAPDTPTLEAILDIFADLDTDVFVTGTDEWTPTETMTTDIEAIIEFPYPSITLRQQFWEHHADALPDDLDPELLAGTFRLTQGELDAALSTARSLATGDELTREAIYAGCSAQSAEELDDLARHIEPASTWDDIELSPDTMRTLRIVRDHITHQARIYGEWGFEEQFSRGTGVVSLFSGPSGTGKTMAAEILANDVGMDLYRIDLSSVVSKYIGETEENLEEIFEAAENSNAILLFDEADAVFGDRAEVSDATDRYANAEVNYLLQRIEAYDGVVLLTTNYEANIDSAFKRRIDHTVSFSRPKEDTRDAIWQGIFPADAPLGEIDYEFLSNFEFTGGQIKTIGQTAAILAAGDAGQIQMQHVIEALQLEADDGGVPLDPTEFGEYRTFLSTSGTRSRKPADKTDTDSPTTTATDSSTGTTADSIDTTETESPDRKDTVSPDTSETESPDTADTDSAPTTDADSTDTTATDTDAPAAPETSEVHKTASAETDSDSTASTETADTTTAGDAEGDDRFPEEIAEAFLTALSNGDREAVDELYHSDASAGEITYKRLRLLEVGNLIRLSPFERERTESELVLLRFAQEFNATSETIEYELRTDGDAWRLYDFGRVPNGPDPNRHKLTENHTY